MRASCWRLSLSGGVRLVCFAACGGAIQFGALASVKTLRLTEKVREAGPKGGYRDSHTFCVGGPHFVLELPRLRHVSRVPGVFKAGNGSSSTHLGQSVSIRQRLFVFSLLPKPDILHRSVVTSVILRGSDRLKVRTRS